MKTSKLSIGKLLLIFPRLLSDQGTKRLCVFLAIKIILIFYHSIFDFHCPSSYSKYVPYITLIIVRSDAAVETPTEPAQASAVEIMTAQEEEPLTREEALQTVIRTSLQNNFLKRGLHEVAKVLDRGSCVLCVLASTI